MPYILSYTKKDDIFSTLVDRPKNMSGHIYFSDVYEAMHLALSRDGKHFTPLRNNTGILFPKATFTEGKPEGTTKTLRAPWLFHRPDGTYGVCGVRRNEDGPDPLSTGCVMLFSSADLIRYEETGFLKVAEEKIISPRCQYDADKAKYYLEYRTVQGVFCGYTADFTQIDEVEEIPEFRLKNAVIEGISCAGENGETVTEICLKAENEDENGCAACDMPDHLHANIIQSGMKENRYAVCDVPVVRSERCEKEGYNSETEKRCRETKGEKPRTEKRSRETRGQKKESFICQNVLEIPEEIADRLDKTLGVIRHVSVDPVVWEVPGEVLTGKKLSLETEKPDLSDLRKEETWNKKTGQNSERDTETDSEQDRSSEIQGRTRTRYKKQLPRAVCRYSDGSVHEKPVDWDEAALAAIDFAKPGTYEIPGWIRQKHWPFPMMKEEISDPCVTHYQGKYYLSATGMRDVSFRISDTIEGCFKAKRTVVWSLPKGDRKHANIWAQELHIIHDVPYVFTTVASPEWYTVQSHVLRCTGDIADPKAWEEPRLCVKPDGTPVEENGISLDMTYFCVDDVHYVMWSNRVVHVNEPGYLSETDMAEGKPNSVGGTSTEKKNGSMAGNSERYQKKEKKREKKKENVVVCEPADIFIATIAPDAPWQLTSDPVRILRPQYGWDRLNTEVDEGPYLLRHGEDLFVTISGSSTGVADLYCLGLLHARAGSDLLRPENWDWLPYPVLTKESVPGEFGPGHNNFVKDPETGDDLMVYHAVPHDENGKSLGRHAGIRRVHWAANGYPYLEMTEERDLDPALKDIRMKVVVGER